MQLSATLCYGLLEKPNLFPGGVNKWKWSLALPLLFSLGKKQSWILRRRKLLLSDLLSLLLFKMLCWIHPCTFCCMDVKKYHQLPEEEEAEDLWMMSPPPPPPVHLHSRFSLNSHIWVSKDRSLLYSSKDHMGEKKINKQKQKIPHVQISEENMVVKFVFQVKSPMKRRGKEERRKFMLSSRACLQGVERGETMETRMDQRTEGDSREERLPPAICQVK